MDTMLDGIEVLNHSSIRIAKDKVIYIDPFKIDKEYNDADIIFCTHSHFDHFSPDDIKKVIKEQTMIVSVEETKQQLLDLGFKENEILIVKPGCRYKCADLAFKTIPAYNIDKNFHSRSSNWVGYNIKIQEKWYYISGDTDNTKDAQKVKCNVAFLPVGGIYTMNYKEAAQLANRIRPELVIPIHYGSLVGTAQDALEFTRLLDNGIDYEILMR